MRESSQKSPLLSVIVPAHNSEQEVSFCIESLRAQTYSNLEIVVVVNGCIDGTERVVKEIAASDDRVRCIVTSESGVSKARNTGLNVSRGDYIGFADADDWVEKDYFENMVSAAIKYRADIVCTGKTIEMGDRSIRVPACEKSRSIKGNDFYYGVLMGPFDGSVWNKLFTKTVIEDVRFAEEMEIIEDSAFCCALADDDSKILAIPGCQYHYLVNDKGATHDLARLVTKKGKWAYLEGGRIIQSQAKNEAQAKMSEKINTTFAASGIRELAGKRGYESLYEELKSYLRKNIFTYMRIERNVARKMKTMIALVAPRQWESLRRMKLK